MDFDVVIEVPQGGRNKYEMDHTVGRIRLDRTLFTATAYPADYGYIENTLARDGDPLDAIVLVGEPTFPGCVIHCRPIGLLCMVDEAGPDNKIICVPSGDTRQEHLRDIIHLPEFHRLEIQHFFKVYKQLEPGKTVVGDVSWSGRREAEAEVTEARAAARRASDPGEAPEAGDEAGRKRALSGH